MKCPACGSEKFEEVEVVMGENYLKCLDCKTEWFREIPQD